jgi:acyl dehydratase
MNAQVNVGDELKLLEFGPVTTVDFVRWTAAVDDYNPIHYDLEIAKDNGLPHVIMQGPFKLSLMIRAFEEWTGKLGSVSSISCRYTSLDVPGNVLVFSATVTDVGAEEVSFTWQCKNQKEAVTAKGEAKVRV